MGSATEVLTGRGTLSLAHHYAKEAKRERRIGHTSAQISHVVEEATAGTLRARQHAGQPYGRPIARRLWKGMRLSGAESFLQSSAFMRQGFGADLGHCIADLEFEHNRCRFSCASL